MVSSIVFLVLAIIVALVCAILSIIAAVDVHKTPGYSKSSAMQRAWMYLVIVAVVAIFALCLVILGLALKLKGIGIITTVVVLLTLAFGVLSVIAATDIHGTPAQKTNAYTYSIVCASLSLVVFTIILIGYGLSKYKQLKDV